MRKKQLSPWAAVLMAFGLALGILVADLTNVCRVTVADAQRNSAGHFIPVAQATLLGRRIEAVDVLVNGVVTRAAFLGRVRIIDSVISARGVLTGDGASASGVLTGDGNSADGVLTGDGGGASATGVLTGDGVSSTGVLTGDGNSADGVLTGDGNSADGVLTGDGGGASVTGGVVEGDNVRVKDGIIYGENLRVVGTTASGRSFMPH